VRTLENLIAYRGMPKDIPSQYGYIRSIAMRAYKEMSLIEIIENGENKGSLQLVAEAEDVDFDEELFILMF